MRGLAVQVRSAAPGLKRGFGIGPRLSNTILLIAANLPQEDRLAGYRYIEREEEARPHYRAAQICTNGHVITSDITNEARMAPRCQECGAETITACPSCSTPIRGQYYVPHFGGSPYARPKYCHHCGRPFPWTEGAVRAWHEIVEESEGLSKDEKERLRGSIDDLIADTPSTNVAVTRVKKWLAKAGNIVGPSVKQIVLDVGTAAVKKSMGL